MVFDPSQFVFQPRPLQQFDFGRGLRALADAQQEKNRLAEQTAQRQDTNSYNAATLARDKLAGDYEADTKKYGARAALVEAARKALQGNDLATAQALKPGIIELGGTFQEDPARPGQYIIEAGQAPNRGQMDVQGMRQQIYGDGAPGQRNPMDPQALPGLSAANAGIPLPGAAGGAPAGAAWLPPGVGPGPSAPTPPEASAPSSGAAQPLPPGTQNPMNPPAFSPYRINMDEVVARNRNQLRPVLDAMQEAAPPTGINIEALNRGVLNAGFSPSTALKDVYGPQLENLIKLENGRQAALAAQGRLEQSRTSAENTREDKLRKEAQTARNQIVQNDDLKKVKNKLNAAKDAEIFLEAAVRNPNAANSLVTKLYNMNEDGLITNQDFSRTSEGMRTIKDAIVNKTLNELFGRTGINERMARDIRETINFATQNQQRQMKAASDKMYQMYKSASTDAERRVYEDGFRMFFPTEYYPPEIAEPWEMGTPGENQTPPAGDSLGKVALPNTLDGRPKVSPNGVPLVRSPRVPQKPPKKPMKPPTDAEIDAASEEELMEMLRRAAD